MATKKQSFVDRYPYLTDYAESLGVVEIGASEYSESWVRLVDEGGTRWEDEGGLSLEEALDAAEAFCEAEFGEDG